MSLTLYDMVDLCRRAEVVAAPREAFPRPPCLPDSVLWCERVNPRLRPGWHDSVLLTDIAGMAEMTGMARSTVSRWWRMGGLPERRNDKRGGRPGWNPRPVTIAGRHRFVWSERWCATEVTPDDVLHAMYCDALERASCALPELPASWGGRRITVKVLP